MRRMLWVVAVSLCAACGPQPNGGDQDSQSGGPTVDTPIAEESPVADDAVPADATEPAEIAEPADVPQPAVVDEPADPSPPAVDAAPILGVIAEQPAEGPFVKIDQGYMVPYTTKIPGTEIEFEMVPVPGGTVMIGSPESEENRGDGEGPQFEVELPPYWMGKYEVTWGEYKEFMKLVDTFIDFIGYQMRKVTDDNRCDAVTAPSNLYDPSVTFENGDDPRQPAVTMTAFGAKQYTKWLSLLTDQIFRLPTEVEWEHACRAGSKTAYSFGDDPADLGEYAWFADNSDETTHEVGLKKPNAFGLYDMHGHVAELVLDEYREDAYEAYADKQVKAAEAVAWPTEYDNRVHRGGSWDDFEEDCRSAARRGSEGDDWKKEDPNEPKSPWWYADEPSQCVGFRIMRPLAKPTQDELAKAWGASVEAVLEAANYRIDEGRGAWGLVDPKLPDAVEEVKKKKAAAG